MTEYKIDTSYDGGYPHHFVRKALGPWPFKNWSWTPVYSSYDKADAEKWIERSLFAESPEGQRQQAEEDAKKAEVKKKMDEAGAQLLAEGWIYEAAADMFVHPETMEIRILAPEAFQP